MNTAALVYPGQGSQVVGMGKEFYEAYPVARQVMQEIEETLKQPLYTLMTEGPLEELTLTSNAQPALLATSLMAQKVLEKELSHSRVRTLAGHSLGEYSALCVGGVFSLKDAALLVKVRGNAMQKAVPLGVGAMAAIIGLSIEIIESLCASFTKEDHLCVVANDNSLEQVVVSGHKRAVQEFIEQASAKGAKRCVMLLVSAPFHSSLMAPAAQIMYEAITAVKIHDPIIPVVCNVTAQPVTQAAVIPKLLKQQITGRVRWRETIQNLHQNGCRTFVEVGTGKVLSNLIKRILPEGVRVLSFSTPSDLSQVLEVLDL